MKKILASMMVVALAVSFAAAGSFAYFDDTETSEGNQITAGTIDLQVNGADQTDLSAKLVDFALVLPNEQKSITTTLSNVGQNEMDVWVITQDVVTGNGTDSEPELVEEAGTPVDNIDSVMRYGLNNGTAVIAETDNYTIATGAHGLSTTGVENQYIYLGTIAPGAEMVVTQTYRMDKDTTNWAQGDTLSFTITFVAQQTIGGMAAPGTVLVP